MGGNLISAERKCAADWWDCTFECTLAGIAPEIMAIFAPPFEVVCLSHESIFQG